ncbi:MAG TPA: TonB family protein [Opitutaceae bacterium]|jgi:RNA polymerase sigma factor (sigma-70 family)
MDDDILLRRYAEHRDQAAFTEIVQRHVSLVYSVAQRQFQGDHHRSQEVTQMVFSDLARKASALASHPAIPAWLHRAAVLAALDLRRRESRRRRYEGAAGIEAGLHSPRTAPDWNAVRPILDEAINSLSEAERRAIVLRFFSGQKFGDIGRSLRVTETAARMRVERALERLHGRLAGHGITSTASALGLMLASNVAMAAPPGLSAASIAAGAASSAVAAPGLWTLIMSSTKLPAAIAIAAIVGGATGTAWVAHKASAASSEAARLAPPSGAAARLAAQNRKLEESSANAQGLAAEEASVSILGRQVSDLEAAQAAARLAQRRQHRLLSEAQKAEIRDLSSLDRLPVPTFQARPVLPPDLSPGQVSGEVVVAFVVGADGRVYNPNVARSTNPALEDAAVSAVSNWTFRPGQAGGQDAWTKMQVPIIFTDSSAATSAPLTVTAPPAAANPSSAASTWF